MDFKGNYKDFNYVEYNRQHKLKIMWRHKIFKKRKISLSYEFSFLLYLF